MKFCCIIILFFMFHYGNAQENYLIVGTYDSPKSEGIYVFKFDSELATAKEVSHIKISNPSFLTMSADEKFVYAVSETAAKDGTPGQVAAYSFDKAKGKLTLLNMVASGGDHPCHVELDKTGRWLFVSNYSSGTLSTLPVLENGMLGAASVITHTGSGPDKARQASAHVHGAFISPDNKMLYVADLGIDKLMQYDFDQSTGIFSPAQPPSIQAVAGSGPRVFTYSPDHHSAYMIEELSGTIQVFKNKKKGLKKIQRVSTMPKGDSQFAGSADIKLSPDGKFLYASNRGESNTMAIYKVKKNGKLKIIAHQSTLGNGPRNFSIDPGGKLLLVANQNSDEIVVFNRSMKTGLLTDSGKRISVGKPVCLKWLSLN